LFWIEVLLSFALPFVALVVFSFFLRWLVMRTPVSQKAMTPRRDLVPWEPPAPLVDAGGNARHESPVELEALRLRRNERRW
jgi:hypothetical protein